MNIAAWNSGRLWDCVEQATHNDISAAHEHHALELTNECRNGMKYKHRYSLRACGYDSRRFRLRGAVFIATASALLDMGSNTATISVEAHRSRSSCAGVVTDSARREL